MKLKVFAILLLYGCTAGCTHVQLRHNSVRQSATVVEIYQQQVLENLAKFVRDPYAMPHFAVASGGLNAVNDNHVSQLGLSWNTFRFTGATLGGNAARSMSQNWTLVPVNDPRKLELMRCAYQQAVRNCHPTFAADCPDCQKRFNRFYTGDSNTFPPLPGSPDSTGIITSNCLNSGWFHAGCAKCGEKILRKNSCCPCGIYCGCAVWVEPGIGTDELTKLTIAILDYALNEPPSIIPPTIEVVAYLGSTGGPATASTATFVKRGVLTAKSDAQWILSEHEKEEFKKEPKIQQDGVKTHELPEPLSQVFEPFGSFPARQVEPVRSAAPPATFDQLFQQELIRVGQ